MMNFESEVYWKKNWKKGATEWLARSPELRPLDFFMGASKDSITLILRIFLILVVQ